MMGCLWAYTEYPPEKEQKHEKDHLYNDVIHVLKTNNIGFTAQQAATIGTQVVRTLTNFFWYLDPFHDRLSSRAVKLPDLFKDLKGYRNFKKQHKKVPQIKKCQSDTCGYCVINPPRLPAEQFAELFFVPDPVTGDNTTYKDFSDVYGTFTTDNARPSLKDATQESQRDKQFKKLLTSAKVRGYVICCECGKRRVIYSAKKLSVLEERAVTRVQEEFLYTCGCPLFPGGNLQDTILVKEGISCISPMEATYYAGLDAIKASKSPHLRKKQLQAQAQMETVRRTRSSPKSESSTPSSLYDFIGESPLSDSNKNSGKKSGPLKSGGKSTMQKKNNKMKTKSVSKSKLGRKKMSDDPKSTVTPKGRVSRPVVPFETLNNEKEIKPINKRLRELKPIPPPNLDDISPIVRDRKSATPSRKRAADNEGKRVKSAERKKLRSSQESNGHSTGNVSFVESEEAVQSDDSAIFVSPRQTMPRFGAAKTSTPADVAVKGPKKTSKKLLNKVTVKNTSTPNGSKPKRNFTGIKENISKLSPVQRTDTPTSDYGSMEIIPTPSPTPTKEKRKKRAYSPAFTLEDDDSGENLNLNKSVDKSYKKSHRKRKYETSGRFSTSKLDEWAEKVNSELEDIENFELSIEG